ncbi:MAG: DUF167 domain-containing protein [Chloroflexota bacterium]
MGERINVAMRVIPRSKTDRVDAMRAGRLVVRVAAAPESGAATRAAQTVLATALGLRVGDIQLEHGSTSRDKTFSIPANARAAYENLSGGTAAGGTAAGPAREARVPRGPVRPRQRSRTGRVR